MRKEKVVSFLSLLGSTSTVLCCALPALLSVIAGGAAVGSLVSAFPWLIPLSKQKDWIFLGAGALLTLNAILTFYPKGKVACSITGGRGCEVAGRFTKTVFWISLSLYSIGAFAAYALVPVFRLVEILGAVP